jgi:hypothetical protein
MSYVDSITKWNTPVRTFLSELDTVKLPEVFSDNYALADCAGLPSPEEECDNVSILPAGEYNLIEVYTSEEFYIDIHEDFSDTCGTTNTHVSADDLASIFLKVEHDGTFYHVFSEEKDLAKLNNYASN